MRKKTTKAMSRELEMLKEKMYPPEDLNQPLEDHQPGLLSLRKFDSQSK